MRWQFYGFDEPGGIVKDLDSYSLQDLYIMQARIEERLESLREKEPHAKRKYEREHKIWFSICQSCIDDLKDVRDAICAKVEYVDKF